MKKLAFLSMALFAFSAFASVRSEDVRLELKVAAKASATFVVNTSVVRVLADGSVYSETFDAKTAKVISRDELAPLSADRMDSINNWIEEARTGEKVTDFHNIHCFAVSGTFTILTADNGNVFLQQSTLCADPTYNNSAAAKELVAVLNQVDQEVPVNSAK